MNQDATWYGDIASAKLHCYMGRQLPPKKGTPQFSAHVHCSQTVVCIRIPLGTEVGLGLGDIVLDGEPTPPALKGHSPKFSANVRLDQMTG